MTIKEATLPVTLHLVFDNDSELFSCELVAIENIPSHSTDSGQASSGQANNTCTLVCEDLMPQTCRLKTPYTSLDASAIHFESGVHLFLDESEAQKLAETFN